MGNFITGYFRGYFQRPVGCICINGVRHWCVPCGYWLDCMCYDNSCRVCQDRDISLSRDLTKVEKFRILFPDRLSGVEYQFYLAEVKENERR